MASIACVVTLVVAAYTPSLLAAPGLAHRRLSDGLIERADKQPYINATPPSEDHGYRRHQLQESELQQRNYAPQHNNYNNVRRRHRKRKRNPLTNGARRLATRRSDTSDLPRAGTRKKDSEVAIILAKLNPGADGSPSAVRPYRLEASGRDLTPLHDDSDETLHDILHALKMQVASRDKANELSRRIFANATKPTDSPELDENLVTAARSITNESVEVNQKEQQYSSMENLPEAYTEPTFESVIQSRADELKTDTSTIPSEYSDDDNNYEATSKSILGNDELNALKDDLKSSMENKMAFRIEPADSDAGDEDGKLTVDTLASEPSRCSQTEDGASSTCLANSAPTEAESPCGACKEDEGHCGACVGDDVQDDVSTSPPETCPASLALEGRDAADLFDDQKYETEDIDVKKEVGLSVNRKSYKISIIFQ